MQDITSPWQTFERNFGQLILINRLIPLTNILLDQSRRHQISRGSLKLVVGVVNADKPNRRGFRSLRHPSYNDKQQHKNNKQRRTVTGKQNQTGLTNQSKWFETYRAAIQSTLSVWIHLFHLSERYLNTLIHNSYP